MEIRFKPLTAVWIYAILAAGLVAIFVAWQMLPRRAAAIAVYGLDGREWGAYAIRNDGDVLRYRLDDSQLKVYWNGATTVYPMANVRSLTITP